MFERFEYLFAQFRRDTRPSVGNGKLEIGLVCVASFQKGPYANFPGLCKFDGVAEQIGQYLHQARVVGNDLRRDGGIDAVLNIQFGGVGQTADHQYQPFHKGFKFDGAVM